MPPAPPLADMVRYIRLQSNIDTSFWCNRLIAAPNLHPGPRSAEDRSQDDAVPSRRARRRARLGGLPAGAAATPPPGHCVRPLETVQNMFITPLCQQHASHTLASRVYGPPATRVPLRQDHTCVTIIFLFRIFSCCPARPHSMHGPNHLGLCALVACRPVALPGAR